MDNRLNYARRRLQQVAEDCEQCAATAVDKAEGRTWSAIAAVARLGLRESDTSAVMGRKQK